MKRDMMAVTTLLLAGGNPTKAEKKKAKREREAKVPGNHSVKPNRNKLAKKSRAKNRKK